MDNIMTDEVFPGLEDIEEGGNEPRLYELGFHIVPFNDEKRVQSTVLTVSEILSRVGADTVKERPPFKVALAYPIEKKIDDRREAFTHAHFGWVAFSLSPHAVRELTTELDAQEGILRYIVVGTTKEHVEAVVADPTLDVPSFEEGAEVQTVGADTDTAKEDTVDESAREEEKT